jgi:hypothetical protein
LTNNKTNENDIPIDIIDGEIWRPIPNFPNYEVSNHGRVKNITSNYILTPIWDDTVKRYSVSMKNVNGKWKNQVVHRLVAITFLDLPINETDYDRFYVRHKDLNNTNNRVENLYYEKKLEPYDSKTTVI